MLKQKWLLLLALIFTPVLASCGGVTVATEQYVTVGFINVENNEIELSADRTSATEQIVYNIVPSNATVKTVKFESKNSNIARVSDTGLVSAVSEGNTTIEVISTANSNIKTTIKVRVVKEAITLSAPTGLTMNASSGELLWEASLVSSGSYYRPTYQLNIQPLGGEEVINDKTVYTKYARFDVDKQYEVTIQALGNKTSYLDSPTSSIYRFMRLSAPTDLALVRLADFGMGPGYTSLGDNVPVSPCEVDSEFNEFFKVRFSINPLLLDLIAKEGEEDTSKGHVSDFYELNVVSSLNNVIGSPIDVTDPNIAKWKEYFNEAKVIKCPDDDKYYACFNVPQNMVDDTYRLTVAIKSQTLDWNNSSDSHIFCCGAGMSNAVRISQLSAPQNLVVRNIANGGEQLSWDAVQYAQGYVLEFKYTVIDPIDATESVVIKTYEVKQIEPNQFEINFSDIETNQPGTILQKSEYSKRDIYIYTMARKNAIADVYYVDSECSETPALIQLDMVENILYTRNAENNGGILSWDKAKANSVMQECFYQVYIGNTIDDILSESDRLIYSGYESAVSEETRFGIILSDENSKWYDGYNYLKIVAWPNGSEVSVNQSGFAKSDAAVSNRFLRLASIEDFQFKNTAIETGIHENPSLVWKWNNVTLPDEEDLETNYSEFGINFEIRINQEIVQNLPYDENISFNEEFYDFILDNNTYFNDDDLYGISIRITPNSDSEDTILIPSATKEIFVKRYPMPTNLGVERGELKFDLIRVGTNISLNVSSYEVLIASGDESRHEYISSIDDISEAIENFINDTGLYDAELFKIKITALQTPTNVDKSYTMDNGKQVYFLDGLQSAGMFVIKLGTPTLFVNSGQLVWESVTPEAIVGKVDIAYELKYENELIGETATYYEFSYGIENNTIMQVRSVVQSNSNQSIPFDVNDPTSGEIYVLNSAWSNELSVSQCSKVAGLSVDNEDGVLSAKWKKTENTTSYRVVIIRSKGGETETVVDLDIDEEDLIADVIEGEDYLKYSLSSIMNSNSGRYSMSVYPNGNDEVLKCKVSDEINFEQLDTPTVEIIDGKIVWNSVSYLNDEDLVYVDTYSIKITNKTDNTITTQILTGGQTSTDLAEFNGILNGKILDIQVQAICDIESVLSSKYSDRYTIDGVSYRVGSSSINIIKWTQLANIALSMDGEKLTWSYLGVTQPNKYLISVITPDLITNTYETNMTQFDLTQFSQAGRYIVKLKARGYKGEGSGVYIDGDFSNAYSFERLPKPQAVALARESVTEGDGRLAPPILTWRKAALRDWLSSNITDLYDLNIKYTYSGNDHVYTISDIVSRENTLNTAYVTQNDDRYTIKLADIEEILGVAFEGGELEFTLVTKSNLVNVDEVSILVSKGATTRGIIYNAPQVRVDSEGNLVFLKSDPNSAGSTLNLSFIPVCNGVIDENNKVQTTIADFIGLSKTYSTKLIENGFGELANYQGFVVKIQAIGNLGTYISSPETIVDQVFVRLTPLNFGDYNTAGEWSVRNGVLCWKNVEGANSYSFVFKSSAQEYNISINSIETSLYEKPITGIDAGNYQLKTRLIGGASNIYGTIINEYFNTYLSSEFSEVTDVVKLVAPQNIGIVDGEFDFGTRNDGDLAFDNYTSKFVITYTENGGENEFVISRESPSTRFIASRELDASGNNVNTSLTVQAIGNTATSSENIKPAFSSDVSLAYELTVPKTPSLIYANGTLRWAKNNNYDNNLQLQYTKDTDEESELLWAGLKSLSEIDGQYRYYFADVEDVKGVNLQRVRIRYKGNTSNRVVNSSWSEELNNIYKLPDIAKNENNGLNTSLWVDDDGALAWSYGESYDELPIGLKNITINYTNNANALTSIQTTNEVYRFTDLSDNSRNVISAQIKIGENVYSTNYIDSDIFSQTFYKIADPRNVISICDDCRIHWETQEKYDGENSIIPTKLIFEYNLNSSAETSRYSIDIDKMSGSIPMWQVGTYSNVTVRAIGKVVNGDSEVVALTLCSNLINLAKGADTEVVVNFNYFTSGSGTPEDPYIIDSTNADSTEANAEMIEALKMVYWLSDMYFSLEKDIRLNDVYGAYSNLPRPQFGQYDYPELSSIKNMIFTGGFNGNGHSISNIYMRANSSAGFGWWNEIRSTTPMQDYSEDEEYNNVNGVITNLTLNVTSIDISGLSTNSFSGVFARMNSGYLLNCTTDETLRQVGQSYLPVFDSNKKLSLSGGSAYIGGLVGKLDGGVVYGCKNLISVKVRPQEDTQNQNNTYVGGIVGFCTTGIISNCVNGGLGESESEKAELQGTIVGGILGGSSANDDVTKVLIIGCENMGFVTSRIYSVGLLKWEGRAGGIVGWLQTGYVLSCVNRGIITSDEPIVDRTVYSVGGICGTATSGNIISSVQMNSANIYYICGKMDKNNQHNEGIIGYCSWKEVTEINEVTPSESALFGDTNIILASIKTETIGEDKYIEITGSEVQDRLNGLPKFNSKMARIKIVDGDVEIVYL